MLTPALSCDGKGVAVNLVHGPEPDLRGASQGRGLFSRAGAKPIPDQHGFPSIDSESMSPTQTVQESLDLMLDEMFSADITSQQWTKIEQLRSRHALRVVTKLASVCAEQTNVLVLSKTGFWHRGKLLLNQRRLVQHFH